MRGNTEFAGTLHLCLNYSVTEPIREIIGGNFTFYQACCEQIDFSNKILHCHATLESNQDKISLPFDKLVIAVGARSNTFNIDGVEEHALFLKDISDARRIRHRVIECFEHSKHPGIDVDEIKRLLNFCIVGGGPTGIEFSAELHDFIWEDMKRLYPDLFQYVKITVYDVAKRILSGFDASLADYAAKKFAREKIDIVTGTGVSMVSADRLVLQSGEQVKTGMIVWATGLAPNNLVSGIENVQRDSRTGRLLTDRIILWINLEAQWKEFTQLVIVQQSLITIFQHRTSCQTKGKISAGCPYFRKRQWFCLQVCR